MSCRGIILYIVLSFVLSVGALFVYGKYKGDAQEIKQNQSEERKEREVTKSVPKLFVSGWVPYWKTGEGLVSLTGHWKEFDEINPFAFEVNIRGNLEDRSRVTGEVWVSARKSAQSAGVKVVPTILWGDSEAMHRILSDGPLRQAHIQKLLAMTTQYDFSGVDIDYEGKDVSDRENFSKFLMELHSVFSSVEKSVRCTVEARDRDDTPADFTGVRAMSWANDFSVLASACDEVRVMAYDQVFQQHRAKVFESEGEVPYAPNADIAWVEEVIRYALRYIPAEKLMLGVPTYGWEFRVTPIADGYRYERVKAVSYPESLQKANNAGVTPMRNVGGEMDFIYTASDGKHLVNFSDAESIAQKLKLARTLGIKGVSIFKIDGETDPGMWEVIKN